MWRGKYHGSLWFPSNGTILRTVRTLYSTGTTARKSLGENQNRRDAESQQRLQLFVAVGVSVRDDLVWADLPSPVWCL